VKRFPSVEAAEARLRRLDAELTEVVWQPLSGIRVEGLVAPTPERQGDAIHVAQRDISFSGETGVLVRARLLAVFPLYTFGRLTAERRAARQEVAAARARVEATRAETRLRVHRAYWSLLLAEQTASLLEEGQGYIGRARGFIEDQLDADEGTVTETDRLRVEVLDSEVEARLSESRKARRIAGAALRLLADIDGDAPVERVDLEPLAMKLRPVSFYAETAQGARPEIEEAKARVRAASEGTKAARARYFPELRLVSDLSYSYSNVVDDQASPFSSDAWNYLRYTVGLSLRWDFDILSDRAKVRQAEARHDQARAEERRSTTEVTRDVEDAYVTVEEGRHVVAARKRGRRAARGWLFAIMQGIDVGVLEPAELVDALQAYFEQSFLYMESVARLNTSIATLEVAAGLATTEERSDE